MYHRLHALDEKNSPIRVAVIGCGRFGSMVAVPVVHAPGMELSILCDLDSVRAIETLNLAGQIDGPPIIVSKVGQVNDTLRQMKGSCHR